MSDDRPLLFDYYCCSGGAGMGYHRAGFRVVGIDINPQPNYPFEFVQADALDHLRANMHVKAVRHTSPPCQASSALTKGTNAAMGWGRRHVDLIGRTRVLLQGAEHITGMPWLIENVAGAKIRKDVTLCGEMFGLEVIRHRHFELGGWTMPQPHHIKHRGRVKGWRHGQYFDGPYFAPYGNGGGKGTVAEWQRALGIDWTTDRVELAEAIPPAYTELIGKHLLEAL
jgi:hypothetical protein